MTAALLALQIYVVAFLLLHDCVTLPPLNDVAAVQAADTRARLLRVTLVSGLPFVVGLAGSVVYAGRRYPAWLVDLLWVSYGLLLAGAARAWWIPYAVGTSPARVARYREMFGATHAFLPERHGIRPNTLHISLHVAMVGVLALLAAGAARR
jgi:hypothetical protein